MYKNQAWFFDSRKGSLAKRGIGVDEMTAFSDLDSAIIDKRFHDFNSKITDDPEIRISPDYKVNV